SSRRPYRLGGIASNFGSAAHLLSEVVSANGAILKQTRRARCDTHHTMSLSVQSPHCGFPATGFAKRVCPVKSRAERKAEEWSYRQDSDVLDQAHNERRPIGRDTGQLDQPLEHEMLIM